MKYLVLVADGMADYPIKELRERTCLEAARVPFMDYIAKNGALGQVKTIPAKMKPASDVANLSILGYDPLEYYSGRAPLEAANLGIELKDNQVAFRCNLITVSGDTLEDYSAGHISTEEASGIIKTLNQKLGSEDIRFYPGVSYRHLLVINDIKGGLLDVECQPPHDNTGGSVAKNLPKGKNVQVLIELMRKSQELLSKHEINQVRIDLKENPANMIWLWGQGKKPSMPPFKDKFGVTGSVISAVDLIKGLGKIIGLEVVEVPGATGYYDTNYLGKADAALTSLKSKDFVFVHVEAPDEAGHNGDIREKILAIERFDQLVVGTVLEALKNSKGYRILVLPDHATPIQLRTHVSDPVMFGIYGSGIEAGNFSGYSEAQARTSKLSFEKGHELMEYFIGNKTLE